MFERAITHLLLGCLLATSIVLVGCELIDPTPGPAPIDATAGVEPVVDTEPASIVRGQALYEQHCATCHGLEAEGTSIWEPPIWQATQITPIVRQGSRGMPAFPTLSDSAIVSIESFLGTLGPNFAALTGVELYAIKCSRCHASDGTGTALGYQIQQPVQDYATFVIRTGRPGDPYPEPMPAYDHAVISDAQIGDMLDWLRSFPKPTDGQDLYHVYCANCHGADARGGIVDEGIRGDANDFGDFLETVREGEGGNRYSRRKDYMPAYPSSVLSREEVRRIADYVRSL